MNIRKLAVVAVLCWGSNLAQAQTNLLTDGNFESFAGAMAGKSSSYTLSTSMGSSVSGWLVTAGKVNLIANGGSGTINNVTLALQSLLTPSTVTQVFSASMGTTYTLDFDYFKRASGSALTVTFGGTVNIYAAPSALSHASLTWTALTPGPQVITFSAALLGDGSNAPTLDNITLTSNAAVIPVPEPARGALLMAGLGCLGLIVRRRRRE